MPRWLWYSQKTDSGKCRKQDFFFSKVAWLSVCVCVLCVCVCLCVCVSEWCSRTLQGHVHVLLT